MRIRGLLAILALAAAIPLLSCKGRKTSKSRMAMAALNHPNQPTLLLSMAQFVTGTDSAGQRTVKPGPAKR